MASEEIIPCTEEYNEEVNCEQATIENCVEIPAGQIVEEAQLTTSDGLVNPEASEQETVPTTVKEKCSSTEPRLTQLPFSRIRNLMKLDPDLQIASLESVFLITKATELFIDSLAKEAFVHTAQSKKKTMQKKDVDMAISSVDSLLFLEGAMNF